MEDASALGLKLTRPLDVKDLPETGIRFDEALTGDFVDVLLGEDARRGVVRFEPEGSGHADVEARPLSPDDVPPVRFSGAVEVSLRTTCVRCLEAVALKVRAPIETTLFPQHDPLAGVGRGTGPRGGRAVPVADGEALQAWDSETFPEPDRLAEEAYDGVRLPLPQIIQQALLIELPADPACLEEAACDARTASLIESANADARASEAAGDPRWAALRALRAEAEAEGGDEPEGKD